VTAALLPGGAATLGVMGGGQLGRMFVHAAQSLGFRTAVLDPDPDSPAGAVAHHHVLAGYADAAGLADLAAACSAVTIEFENVPAQALRTLAARVVVAPSDAAVQTCQDRAAEKRHFERAGVACAPFQAVESDADVAGPNIDRLLPGILKTARLGYDGKGQMAVGTATELAQAWAQLKRAPCVLEKRLPLRRELSVVVARAGEGHMVHLPVQQNLHRDGILAVTQVPAPDVSPALALQAVTQALRLADSLGYVGVLCVEFFVLDDGSLVANEMAPRPHNSGHYSIDACDVSQFELQVRTLAGLPLVAPRLHSPAVMLNLLGDLWFAGPGVAPVEPDWAALLALPGIHLHLYGKSEPRPGRKMGHVTATAADAGSARATALQAAALLHMPAF
jgi:5-(carboxyamino)imidazole ribonucleotide synthase